jgi:aminoglycoside phosphotransferase (APT) family kinase protein
MAYYDNCLYGMREILDIRRLDMSPLDAGRDTASVRPGEELNATALAGYLMERLGGTSPIVEVEQFPNGHSNLVYLIRAGAKEFVLRRPPLGSVPPKAHDMAREYRVLDSVHPHFPEAPRVLLLCEDRAVIGSAFFLMERRRGIVIRDVAPPELCAIPEHPRMVSEAFIDCMVRLHAIDVSRKELRTLGKPEGFLERQVHGWAGRWKQAKTEELPEMNRVIRWLADRLHISALTTDFTLVHNDYKLDNVMMHPAGDRVEAVLDWEMTTLGDPLADLGLTMCYWAWMGMIEAENAQGNPPEDGHAVTPVITSQPGWYTRNQFLERYARQTGRDVSRVGYYEVLGVFKLAVILQQIFYRFHLGQTQDARFRNFDRRVGALARLAASLMERKNS